MKIEIWWRHLEAPTIIGDVSNYGMKRLDNGTIFLKFEDADGQEIGLASTSDISYVRVDYD